MKFCEDLSKFSAREIRSETLSCNFGWCRYQNNPRLSWSLSFGILIYIKIHWLFRLQLKCGLLWYRHHPKMHEMVSDRSSRAENWTDLRKISMRVSFNSNNVEKWSYGRKKTQKCSFSWTNPLRSYTGHTKVGKKQIIRYKSSLNLINIY